MQNFVAGDACGDVVNHGGNHDARAADARSAVANGGIYGDSFAPAKRGTMYLAPTGDGNGMGQGRRCGVGGEQTGVSVLQNRNWIQPLRMD